MNAGIDRSTRRPWSSSALVEVQDNDLAGWGAGVDLNKFNTLRATLRALTATNQPTGSE